MSILQLELSSKAINTRGASIGVRPLKTSQQTISPNQIIKISIELQRFMLLCTHRRWPLFALVEDSCGRIGQLIDRR